MSGWLWVLLALGAVVVAAVLVLVAGLRQLGGSRRGEAVRILQDRRARGDVGELDYRARLALLTERSGFIDRRSAVILAAVAAAVLVSGGLAAAASIGPMGWPAPWNVLRASCAAPALPGSVVAVTLTDMGAMMMGGRLGPDVAGMARVLLTPAGVPAGQVSLRVTNTGMLRHELLVLPLAADQPIGLRRVGSHGQVSEQGGLGEASRTCGAGSGSGIAPGGTGWTTLTLVPGRYELICNRPGHYAMGMFAELDVS